MNLNERQQALIEKYLDNKLSDIQEKDFEVELKNEGFRKQLLFQAQMVDSHRAIEKEKLLKQLESFAQANKKDSKSKLNLGLLIGIILLSLLSYALIYNLKPDNHAKELYAQYFIELPANVNQRGGNVINEEDYIIAMQSYIEGDYNKAKQGLEPIAPINNKAKLYLAICYMHTNNFIKARETLKSLKDSEDINILENAEWYLSLVSVKEGNFNKSKEELQVILLNKNHLFFDKAEELMSDLDDL